MAESSEKVSHLVTEISAASNEQSEGISQVNKAVVEMDNVTQQNAAGTEELSSQAEELNNQVSILLEIVEGQSSHREISEKENVFRHLSLSKTRGNKTRRHLPKEVKPNQVIPMDNDDFTDF